MLYTKAQLYKDTSYSIKVYWVKIQGFIKSSTKKVKENIKELITKNNRGVEITEIRWLNRVDKGKHYKSILIWQVKKNITDSFCNKGWLK